MRGQGALVIFALCASCGGGSELAADAPDATVPDAAPVPRLTLGTGDAEFIPLLPGGSIILIMGRQGGFHVFLTLRASLVDPGTREETPRPCSDPGSFRNPCIDFDVFDLSTSKQLDAFAALRLPLTSVVPDEYDLLPPRLVQLAVRSFSEIVGHDLLVRAVLDDAAGRHVVEEMVVVCTQAPG